MAGASRFVLPAPADVFRAFQEFHSAILSATWTTLVEVLLGFGAAVIVGILLATGISVLEDDRCAPLSAPPRDQRVAQDRDRSFATHLDRVRHRDEGRRGVPDRDLSRSSSRRRWASGRLTPTCTISPARCSSPRLFTFWKVDLPSALPSIFAGLKVGITLAVTGALVGEFISATEGLGFLIRSAVSPYQTPLAFAVVIAVAAMSMALFGAVAAIEHFLVPWARGAQRERLTPGSSPLGDGGGSCGSRSEVMNRGRT